MKKTWNLSKIMLRAWKNFRKGGISFAEALHRSWLSAKGEKINAQRIETAKAAAGITEEVNTWSGWKTVDREVVHGSKACFSVDLIWGSRGDGKTYRAAFFAASQTEAVAVA